MEQNRTVPALELSYVVHDDSDAPNVTFDAVDGFLIEN